MKIKDLIKTKQTKILVASGAIYFGLLFYLKPYISSYYTLAESIISLLFFFGFIIAISKMYKKKRPNMKTYFWLGMLGILTYSLIMTLIFNGNLNIDWLNVLLGSLEMGLLTAIVAFVWGVPYE